MLLPMMGFLFTLFVVGVSCAMILAVVTAWRWLVPFTLVPVLAAVGAGLSCWGLAERVGFLVSYVLGGLFGVGLGAGLALYSVRKKLNAPRWRKLYQDYRCQVLDTTTKLFS